MTLNRAETPPLVRKHGGEYLARGGATEVLEGRWIPRRIALREAGISDSEPDLMDLKNPAALP